ncbi:MAG TPA: hypothetical protein VGI92_10980 [Gemmatimonadales bacterium]|jgi:hypothetical protein
MIALSSRKSKQINIILAAVAAGTLAACAAVAPGNDAPATVTIFYAGVGQYADTNAYRVLVRLLGPDGRIVMDKTTGLPIGQHLQIASPTAAPMNATLRVTLSDSAAHTLIVANMPVRVVVNEDTWIGIAAGGAQSPFPPALCSTAPTGFPMLAPPGSTPDTLRIHVDALVRGVIC